MSNKKQNESENTESPVQPVGNPIICNPFEEPRKHWFYRSNGVPVLMDERRKASYWYKNQKSYTSQTSLFATEESDELPLVNLLRDDVRRWRESKYEMASPITKKLLEHWNNKERERKLFFCQLEAVETIVYITEVLGSNRRPRWNTKLLYEDYLKLKENSVPVFMKQFNSENIIMPRLIDIPNESEFPSLVRYGCKMATGSGKTVVMSMLIAWSFCNRAAQPNDTRFPDAALILCPNLTIRERLQVLRPEAEKNYYIHFNIVPATLMPMLQKGKVLIENWHQLALESPNSEGGETFRIVNKGDETPPAFAKRVLGEMYDRGPIMVLNDEGHHAYRPKPVPEEEILTLTEEERKEREEATIWVSGIDRINMACGVKFCIDLSATPFYIKGSGYTEGSPFPWLVNEFGLVDAIESGIVKIPRIPVSDQTGLPLPKYFDLWKHITDALTSGQKLPGGRPRPEVVWTKANDALIQLASQYKERFGYYVDRNTNNIAIPPAMIVVCDNTKIAELFYKNISGETTEEREERITRGKKKGEIKIVKQKGFGRGQIFPEIFSNTKDQLNTFRIDSKIIEETDTKEGLNKDEAKKQIRNIADTIGQKGKPGEQVKCVVSVQMLTEGWDANNVTHIFGLRAFQSQLLIEQVVGRGLRRMNYSIDPETNMFPPEYVDVYGIPFSVIPFKGRPTHQSAPEDKPDNHVRALPEREHLKIEFPVIDGYVFDLKNNIIKVDLAKLELFQLQPLKNPIATFVQPQIGYKTGTPGLHPSLELVEHNREAYYQSTHLQTIKFEITRHIVHNLTYGRDNYQPKLKHQSRAQLFPQVFKVVDHYLNEKVDYKGYDKREIGLATYTQKIIDLLTAAIVPDNFQGEPPLLPQLNKYKPIGSTEIIDYTTKKPVTNTKKSHINLVVADTKQWEQSAAFVLEAMTNVKAYVKNDRLDFTIPYEYDGEPHPYEPDYIVKLTNGLSLILEIKGYEDDLVRAKHQGAKKWVTAINNWGRLGVWDFVVCKDIASLHQIFKDEDLIWRNFSKTQLAKAYDNDEPEYSEKSIKRRNPKFKK
jgi:type III restriction enzyme